MELSQIIRRAFYVLRAIDGRSGLDQLDRASLGILLRIAEAELSGDGPQLTVVVEGSGEGRDQALSRLTALERGGWLSSSGPSSGLSRRIYLTRRAKRAFVVTAAQLQRRPR